MNMETSPVWFITGASTGFGRELAMAALAKGDRVVATARNNQSRRSGESTLEARSRRRRAWNDPPKI